jgi:hypothetical protein
MRLALAALLSSVLGASASAQSLVGPPNAAICNKSFRAAPQPQPLKLLRLQPVKQFTYVVMMLLAEQPPEPSRSSTEALVALVPPRQC